MEDVCVGKDDYAVCLCDFTEKLQTGSRKILIPFPFPVKEIDILHFSVKSIDQIQK